MKDRIPSDDEIENQEIALLKSKIKVIPILSIKKREPIKKIKTIFKLDEDKKDSNSLF